MLPIYGVALLGFFQAEAALPILVALARHPEADDLLGDAIPDLLPPALAGCAKSNPSALFPLIEDEAAEEFCSSSAVTTGGTPRRDSTPRPRSNSRQIQGNSIDHQPAPSISMIS